MSHSASALGISLEPQWISSADVTVVFLKQADGLLVAPGPPHRNIVNSLAAIKFGREHKRPTLGTCGGFQLMSMELAQNILNLGDVSHAEYSPESKDSLIAPLQCSLKGQHLTIKLAPDSIASALYKSTMATEKYYCSFGINRTHASKIRATPLKISGEDEHGDIRIAELLEHPFFIATLFVPQARSTASNPHPLISGFLNACAISSGTKC